MDHFPRDWGENKNVWNHHLDYTGSFGTQNPHIFSCIHIAVSLIYLEHHQKHIISSLPIKTHWNMKKTQQPPFQSFIQRTNTLGVPSSQQFLWTPELSAPGRRTPWKLAKPLTEHYQVDWAWHKVGQVTIVWNRVINDPYEKALNINGCDWGYFTILQLRAHIFFEFVIPLGAAVQSFGFHEKNTKQFAKNIYNRKLFAGNLLSKTHLMPPKQHSNKILTRQSKTSHKMSVFTYMCWVLNSLYSGWSSHL